MLTLDAGSGDEAQASESIEASINGEDITTGFNPQFLLDGLTVIDQQVIELAFTQASKPVVLSGSTEGEARDRVPLPADAAPAPVLTRTGPRLSAMDIGLVGLGKMGGNMRTRLRNAGHTVIGYDRNPDLADADSLAAMVEQLPSPKVVWVMVPAGDPTRGTIQELGELLGEGDLVVDGGNSKWTDDQLNAEMLADEGHRLRRLRRLRRRLGSAERLRADVRRHRRGRRQGPAGASTRSSPRRAASSTPARSPAPATSPRWSTTASSTR